MLWVQNMANKPDFDILEGWVTRKVMIRTATKTIVLAKRIDRRNNQLTELKLSVAMDVNIMEGNANVPTNVFSPIIEVIILLPGASEVWREYE